MEISKRADELAPSGIRKFFDLVLGMKDIISLGVGEPDFITPWNIRESAIYSLEQGYTSYTSNKGLKELRIELARFLTRRHGLDYDPEEEILITVGVSEAMDLAMRSIINPGDKVLIASPYYVSYGPTVSLAGGKPVFIKTNVSNGFKLLPEQIRAAADKRTKVLLINYPSNPTGTSYTKGELEKIKAAALGCGLLIISDEIYEDLTYDFPHTPMPTLKGAKTQTLYLSGFSKGYAMTGWRIGYACGPKKVIGAMTKIHQYTMLCAPIMGQMAALEALRNGKGEVELMRKEYKRRRNLLISRLNELGLSCHNPQGAFYAFPSIKSTRLGSVEFAEQLLKKEKVAVVPGPAFGTVGEGYIRISYASSIDNLKEALLRIAHFLKKL